jgi:hypothetical protein
MEAGNLLDGDIALAGRDSLPWSPFDLAPGEMPMGGIGL